MNAKDVVENVAAGLRRMKNKPDYLLFLQDMAPWTWDMETICGIPVIHTEQIKQTGKDWDILFHPMWKSEGDRFMDITDFQRGYEEGRQS